MSWALPNNASVTRRSLTWMCSSPPQLGFMTVAQPTLQIHSQLSNGAPEMSRKKTHGWSTDV